MTRKTFFDADLMDVPGVPNIAFQTRLQLTISIECRDPDGCDATYYIESIILPNGELLAENQLSDKDQVRLDRLCQDIADEGGPEAAHEHAEALADYIHDSIRHGD